MTSAEGATPNRPRVAKIGTKNNPAVVRVQTEERAHQVLDYCDQHGITAIIGLEPDKDEDITDIARALDALAPQLRSPKVGRNDPCPCSSGRKYKKCCINRSASAG